MSFEDNLKKLNIILPEAKAPVRNELAAKTSGKMLLLVIWDLTNASIIPV